MPLRKQIIVFFFLVLAFGYITTITLQSCRPGNSKAETKSSIAESSNAYVGPDACQSCHAKEYADWTRSDHFKAMMVANDSNVLGDFNNASLNADGVVSRFFKRQGKFFINTEGPDGKNSDYEVKYTFGYYPLQQYLVEFPGGRMQVPRQSYDVVKRKWFHQYAGQKVYHGDWLHWTKQAQNWNSMCAACHSTNLQRNYDEATDSYHTTYSNITVTCESCHGKGKNHIDYINTAEYKAGDKIKGSYLLLHKGQTNKEQLSGCVICHARRMEVSPHAVASTEIPDNFIPNVSSTENYFPDGQFRDEDYEYGSFTQSKMYHRGVKCSNCHNPHSGKIVFTGNKLCLQCHQTRYDSPEHYFHAVNTEGAQCINCHMPTRTYMGNDIRRDHSMRIPRPDQSVLYQTPNACNKCHSDKSAKWAADVVVKWYGPKRKHHYTDDLIPGSRLNQNSLAHLKNLLADTSVTETIRATALNYLGQIQSEESLNAIKQWIHDTSAIVRYQVAAALSNFPATRWASDAVPLLHDPVRGVRISAANSLSGLPIEVLGQSNADNLAAEKPELMDYLHHQSDFPTGNIMLADYYLKTGDNKNAEKYYLRAIKIDSLANYARLNLSSVYNAEGQNEKALSILLQALKVDPANPRINYNLALLNVEQGKKEDGLKYFDRAYKLKYDYDRLYSNYALFQQQLGNAPKAEKLYVEGLSKYPNSETLNYGAAYYYVQTRQKEKALVCIRKLKTLNPGNENYRELFQLLR